ncbi:MAG: mechanosensitive ion channel domain-containing protein [Mangrovibacterium sp.]
MKLIAHFILLFLFIGLSGFDAQAVATQADSLAGTPFQINQISIETENTQRFLRTVYAQLGSTEHTASLDSVKLAEIEKINKINNYLADDKINNLDAKQTENLQIALRKEHDELNKMRQNISDKTNLVDSNLKQARLQKRRWENTLAADSLSELPESLIDRINKNTHELDSAIVLLSTQNKELLYHQDEITNAILSLEEVHTKVKKRLDDYRTQIYSSNSLPIWEMHTLHSDSTSIFDKIKSSLRTKKFSLIAYKDTYNHLFLFWFISFAIIAAFILHIHRNLRKINNKDKKNKNIPHPIITALFMSTLLTQINYPNAPALIRYILQIALFIPTLTLFPLLWRKLPIQYFVFAVATVAIVIATNMLSDLIIINRLFMLANSVLLVSMYIHILRNKPELELPLSFPLILIGIITISFSIICNILGNTYLMSVFFNGSVTAVFGAVLLYSAREVIFSISTLIVEDEVLGRLHIFEEHSKEILHTLKKIIHALLVFFWVMLTAKSLVVFESIYDWLGVVLSKSWTLGSISISLGNIAAFVITFALTIYISRFIRFILEGEIFVRTHTSKGVAGAILMLVRLCLFAVGVIFAMGAADIDVSNITIIFGALGVGIGFGLQTIFNNLASGIILAFERPIKAGDMVQIHSLNLWGEVKEIGIRASTITTFDGADVIVPNGNLLANEMINWTHSNHRRRQEVLVGVAYGTDLDKVTEILTDVIDKQVGIIKKPEPTIIFTGFGDSSLDFSIRFWTHFNDGLVIKSAIGIAIDKAFKQAGIEIPFPQRDLHIIQNENSSLKVKQTHE